MPKALKLTLAAAGGLVALLLVVVLVIVATFDANAYKPQLADAVRQQYQRTLAVPGPISLTIFPRLGVKVGEVTLSERNSSERFASIVSAQVALALWPLLRKEVVVDRIAVTGLNARVVRGKDGKLNIDDLLGGTDQPKPPAATAAPAAASAPAAAPLKLAIAGITLTDANLTFDDRQAPRRVQLSKATLQTGRFAPGAAMPLTLKARLDVDAPKLGSELTLQGKVQQGPEPGQVAVQELQLDLTGAFGALPLRVRLAGALEGHTEQQRYSAKAFTLTLDTRPGDSPLSMKLQMPWSANLQAGTIDAPKLELEAKLPNPKDAKAASLPLAASGSMAVKTGTTQRLDAKLTGQFDASRFTLAFGMPRFSPAAYTFDLELDRLDVDRYRAPAPAAAAASGAAAGKPLDLSALRDLEATGQLRIGALQAMNLKASQLRAGVRATAGRVTVGPLAAQLYEGQLGGSLGVVASSPPRFALQPSLNGVAVGPLLKDLAGFDRLLGRGNVALDLAGSGATPAAITRSLAGGARVELRDGAVRGINIAQAIRSAKAAAKGGGDGTAARDQATDFSELSASFKVAGGVARNDDLALKSPLMRIGGNGSIDLAANQLDYTVKATVVDTLKGQGGAELQALRGQTVPVKLSGPFDAIQWRIDFGGMLKEAAQAKIDEKKDQLKEDAKRRLGDQLRGLIKKR